MAWESVNTPETVIPEGNFTSVSTPEQRLTEYRQDTGLKGGLAMEGKALAASLVSFDADPTTFGRSENMRLTVPEIRELHRTGRIDSAEYKKMMAEMDAPLPSTDLAMMSLVGRGIALLPRIAKTIVGVALPVAGVASIAKEKSEGGRTDEAVARTLDMAANISAGVAADKVVQTVRNMKPISMYKSLKRVPTEPVAPETTPDFTDYAADFRTEDFKKLDLAKTFTPKDVQAQLTQSAYKPLTPMEDFDNTGIKTLLNRTSKLGKKFDANTADLQEHIKQTQNKITTLEDALKSRSVPFTTQGAAENAMGSWKELNQLKYDLAMSSAKLGEQYPGVGGVFDTNGKPFTSRKGYQVGLISKIANTKANSPELKDIIDQARTLAKTLPGVTIGIWDGPKGTVSVDVGMYTPDRELAQQLGRRFNQQAIWDWKSKDLVSTGGTGESVNLSPEEVFTEIAKLTDTTFKQKAKELYDNPTVRGIVEVRQPDPVKEALRYADTDVANTKVSTQAKKLASKIGAQLTSERSVAKLLGPSYEAQHKALLRTRRNYVGLSTQLKEAHMKTVADNLKDSYKLPVKGDPLGLSSNNRVSLYAQLQDLTTRKQLVQNGVEEGSIKDYLNKDGSVKNFLTPAEMKTYQDTRALLERIYPKYAEAYEKITGKLPPKIEQYWPKFYKRYTGVSNSQEDTLLENLKSAIEGTGYKSSMDLSRGKQRSNQVTGKLDLNFVGTLGRYYDNVARIIAYADQYKPTLARLKYQLPEVAKATNKEVANAWHKHILNNLFGETTDKNPIVQEMMNITYSTTLSANPIKQMLVQFGSVFNSMDKLGVQKTLRGLMSTANPEYKKLVQQDPLLRTAMMDPVLQEYTNQVMSGKKGFDQDTQKLAAYLRDKFLQRPMTETDQLVRGGAYKAAYDDYLAKHPKDIDGAMDAGIEMAESTQSMSDPAFRMLLQKNQIGRAISMYQTQQAAVFNENTRNLMEVMRGTMTKREFGKHVFFNTVLPTMYQAMVDTAAKAELSQLMEAAAGNPDDETRQKYVENVARSSMQNILILGSWLNGFEYSRGKVSFPFTRPIETAYKDWEVLFSDKSFLEKAYQSLNTYANLRLKVDLKAFKDIAELTAGYL